MSESENKPQTDQIKMSSIPYVKSDLIFAFGCPECGKRNTMDWYAWLQQKGLRECIGCEKAMIVVPPWER